MSSNCTVLGYVANIEMMKYFLDKEAQPNIYDVSAIAFGSKSENSKIEVLEYYLTHQFKDFKEERKPKNYYDNFGHNYSVARYLNPDKPLETMLFISSIKSMNRNLYEYLKPKLESFNIYQPIPFRWDTVDDCVDEDNYYILEVVVKELSIKCKENEVFMEEIKSKKNRDELIKDADERNQEVREWISFLFDEGLSPFIGVYNSNIYFDIEPFTRLTLNREVDLIKKAIELFPDDWESFKFVPNDYDTIDKKVDLLKNIISYAGYKSNYYDRNKDPEVYRYSFKPKERDEIIIYLAQNGYPFYKSSLFKSALKGSYFYKFDYTEYRVEINSTIFWEIVNKYTPQGDGTLIFSDTSFSDEQNEILEKKGYALSKSEQLQELIEKIGKTTYSSDLMEKAQKMIDSGVKLNDPMLILFKFFWYIEGREDHSKAIRLIVDNDLVSKEQFREFFEKENSAYRTGGNFSGNEKIFEQYCDIKKPLFDKYRDVILSLPFELQKEYFLHNCNSEDEAYLFLKNHIDELRKKDIEWDIKYHKNWYLYRALIKLSDERDIFDKKSFSAYFLKELLDRNAPEDILRWADSKVKDLIAISSIETLDDIIRYNLSNQISILKERVALLNISDRYSKTLLHKACSYLSIEKINKLLDIGLKVNINDKYSYTPLDSFLKAKPDVKNEEHFETFKRLLKELLREGGKPTDSIKLIKPKKYKEYQDLLNDYSSIEEELNSESNQEDRIKEAHENELVEVTIYRTKEVTYYKRYAIKTKIPRKELNKEGIAKEYYNSSKEEFDSEWESGEVEKFEVKK